jgi:hypothetical protein
LWFTVFEVDRGTFLSVFGVAIFVPIAAPSVHPVFRFYDLLRTECEQDSVLECPYVPST